VATGTVAAILSEEARENALKWKKPSSSPATCCGDAFAVTIPAVKTATTQYRHMALGDFPCRLLRHN
jgi:hypothetical protein